LVHHLDGQGLRAYHQVSRGSALLRMIAFEEHVIQSLIRVAQEQDPTVRLLENQSRGLNRPLTTLTHLTAVHLAYQRQKCTALEALRRMAENPHA
jgi:hypothetical protein